METDQDEPELPASWVSSHRATLEVDDHFGATTKTSGYQHQDLFVSHTR